MSILRNLLRNLVCEWFYHKPGIIDHKKMEAVCIRCNKLLDVGYDITYGETIVIGVKE